MESVRERMFLFAVRQTLGRIVKDVQKEHLERIERTQNSLGISFDISHLELDDAFINKELLGFTEDGNSSPSLVRLVNGFVNGLRVNLSFNAQGRRTIEVDGLQLVFDVTPQVECAVPKERPPHRRTGPNYPTGTSSFTGLEKGHNDGGASSGEEDEMYSSLFMSDHLRQEVEESVVVPALRDAKGLSANQPSGFRQMINEGLEAFGRSIKQLAHSVTGCIRNVTIILRIPPLGQRIIPGQEPPEGSIELLIYFEGGFVLEDMQSDVVSDSIRKRIRFSNVRVALYPYGQRRTTRSDDKEVEESVDLADVFLCGGRVDDFTSNDLVLHISESRGAGLGPEALLDAKVTIKSLLLVLSPRQLSRLLHVARALVGAPKGNEKGVEEAAAPRAVRFITKIKSTCQFISCTLMTTEDAVGLKNFWNSLQEQTERTTNPTTSEEETRGGDNASLAQRHRLNLHQLLRQTGYYNVYIGGIYLLLQPATASTSRTEDAFHDVFENYGGRGCSVGIGVMEVYERPKCNGSIFASTTDVTEGGRLILTTKQSSETQPERRYRIAFVSRTTRPLTPEEAFKCNCVPFGDVKNRNSDLAAVVLEHVLVKTSGAVLLGEVDAGVMERLGNLWAQLKPIFASLNQQEHEQPQVRRSKRVFLSHSASSRSKDRNEDQFVPVTPDDYSGTDGEGSCTLEPRATTPYLFLRFVTAQLDGVTLEMKFPAANHPDPDYYGPLSRRLWEHLRSEGEALVAPGAVTPYALGGADAPYLPITMSVYLQGLDVSVGSEGVLELFLAEGQLTLHDYKEGTQENIVQCIFDTSGKEPCISIRQKQKPSHDVSSNKWNIPSKAPTPFGDAYEEAEQRAESTCLIALNAHIQHVSANLRQDQFLLTLFFLDQAVETVDKLLDQIAPPDPVAPLQIATNTDTILIDESGSDEVVYTRVCVQLSLRKGTLSLWAPRLSSASFSVGEPLWRCIPERERCQIEERSLRHHYEVTVSKVFLFANHEASATFVKTAVHVEASDFCLDEHLCEVRLNYSEFPWPPEHASSPQWGQTVTLLQSYTDLYNRANNIRVRPPKEDVERNKTSCGRHGACLSLCRNRSLAEHTEVYDVAMQFGRVFVGHQTSHEGDHWLFVLLNFFSDAGTENLDAAVAQKEMNSVVARRENSKDETNGHVHTTVATVGADNDHNHDVNCSNDNNNLDDKKNNDNEVDSDNDPEVEVRSEDGVPMATSANVRVTLTDVLLEYKPFGTYFNLVALVPQLELTVSVPSLFTETTVVRLFLGSKTASVFLHNNFVQDLLKYDRDAGLGSIFGSSERGIATDLRGLGFVLVLEVRSPPSISEENQDANVTVYVDVTSEKPLFIEVQRICASAFFAHDSLHCFRTLVSHYLGSLDTYYLPSPHLLVQRSGPFFEHIAKPELRQEDDVAVYRLVPDFEAHITRLLNSSALEITPQERKAEPLSTEMAENHEDSSFDDFDVVDIHECPRPVEIQWTTRDNLPVDLTRCCTRYNFLSVNNIPSLSGNSRRYVPRRMSASTPIIMELFLFDCDANVHLYGGEDFLRTDVPQSYLQTIQRFGMRGDAIFKDVHEESITDMWNEEDSGVPLPRGCCDGRLNFILGGGRRKEEFVVGRVLGIRLQVDLFVPGQAKFTQLHLDVRDGEVIDCIEGSPMRTLLMSSQPPELRDHDSDLLELRWTTFLPRTNSSNAGTVILGQPEEEVILRVQPITVALHRRAINLLPKFFEVPEDAAHNNSSTRASHTDPLFFSKIFIYPTRITLYVHFEGQNAGQALRCDVFELCNYILPSLERSQVIVPPILITACPADCIGNRIEEQLSGEIFKLHGIFMLCCGVQPLQLASSIGSAGADVLFAPLNDFKRNKHFFSALSRALRRFLMTIAVQSLHSATVTSQSVQSATTSSITYLVPTAELQPLSRGSQPISLMDGLHRGFMEFIQSFRVASNIAAYCLGKDGNLVRLPITVPTILDGFLRGTVEVFRGIRNGLSPELREQERKLFKGERRKVK